MGAHVHSIRHEVQDEADPLTLACLDGRESEELARESGGVFVVTAGDMRAGALGGSCAEAALCMSPARGEDDCTGLAI